MNVVIVILAVLLGNDTIECEFKAMMLLRTLALCLKNLDFHCLLKNVTYHVIYGDDNHHHSIQIHLRSFICGHKID